MSEGANCKSFADSLAFSLIHDAGFSPIAGGGGLVKRDLGAMSCAMVMCVVAGNSTQEQIISNINNSIQRARSIACVDSMRRSAMMSVIYVFEDYGDFSPFLAPVFKGKQKEIDENGFLVDFIIYDIKPGIKTSAVFLRIQSISLIWIIIREVRCWKKKNNEEELFTGNYGL